MPRPEPAMIMALCAVLCGCATQPGTRDPRDPFERVNRGIYSFNDHVDRGLAKPAARIYRHVTPRPVRTGVSNFFGNLEMPLVLVNDLLQGKFRAAAQDTGRLLLNSTLGLGGLLDPATKAADLPHNDEDFGQTLGRWGLPPGPYLVVPVLGPSSVRDSVGRVADQFAEPINYVNNDTVLYGAQGLKLLDKRASLLDAEKVLSRTFDPYVVIRNAYLQRRAYQVSDGEVTDTPADEGFSEEELKEAESGDSSDSQGGAQPESEPPPNQDPTQ
ncbi:MAG: VacJ family lipoprotein [Steroidobacteraceae bacterium]